ncbi:MAG: phage tail sheath C-terminal domain-containing protein [Chthoniobacterales bacterium]
MPSDFEWKYVSLRSYLAYLKRSIDQRTTWILFEPNREFLWRRVRHQIEAFLFVEFQQRKLAGRKPEQAFFVRCDRSTMTQDDIDAGRLIAVVGVALLRPAEFVVFRIGQWTADHKP